MARTFSGGCHCGAVRFEAVSDLETVIECNCSHCKAKGFLLTFVPPENFKLISGGDNLTDYRFNTHNISHLFCKTCGVQSFGRGQTRSGMKMAAINVRCLDDIDLGALTLTQVDGKSF